MPVDGVDFHETIYTYLVDHAQQVNCVLFITTDEIHNKCKFFYFFDWLTYMLPYGVDVVCSLSSVKTRVAIWRSVVFSCY